MVIMQNNPGITDPSIENPGTPQVEQPIGPEMPGQPLTMPEIGEPPATPIEVPQPGLDRPEVPQR